MLISSFKCLDQCAIDQTVIMTIYLRSKWSDEPYVIRSCVKITLLVCTSPTAYDEKMHAIRPLYQNLKWGDCPRSAFFRKKGEDRNVVSGEWK